MAYFGDIPDELKLKIKLQGGKPPVNINLDVNHQAISSHWPPTMPSHFTVPADSTYEQIAEDLNWTGYASAIAFANGSNDPNEKVEKNTIIKIPPIYVEIPETAWNGSVPPQETILGSLYPGIPAPHLTLKPHHMSFSVALLEVAASVAIMTLIPGGVIAASGVIETMFAYLFAGGLASVVSQNIGICLGDQKSFDGKSAVATALMSAISAGVLKGFGSLQTHSAFMQKFSNNIIKDVAVAEGVAAAEQIFLQLSHLQKHPDWRAFASAAVNASAGHVITNQFGEGTVSTAGLNTLAGDISNDLIYGKPIVVRDIAANVIGSMVGTGVGNHLNERLAEQRLEIEERWKEAHYEAELEVGERNNDNNETKISSHRDNKEKSYAMNDFDKFDPHSNEANSLLSRYDSHTSLSKLKSAFFGDTFKEAQGRIEQTQPLKSASKLIDDFTRSVQSGSPYDPMEEMIRGLEKAVMVGGLVRGVGLLSRFSKIITPVRKWMDNFTFFARNNNNHISDLRKKAHINELTSPRQFLLDHVEHPKLRSMIEYLYRKGATVGNGGTADVVRTELSTGKLYSRTSHLQKAIQARLSLQRLINKGGLNQDDLVIAQILRQDLHKALSENNWNKVITNRLQLKG